MQTVLFHETIFGPIHSRRLGTSLGVNLSPATARHARSTVFTARPDSTPRDLAVADCLREPTWPRSSKHA